MDRVQGSEQHRHWQEVTKSLELEEQDDEASILVDVPIIVKQILYSKFVS